MAGMARLEQQEETIAQVQDVMQAVVAIDPDGDAEVPREGPLPPRQRCPGLLLG